MKTRKIETERFDEVIAFIRRSFPNLVMEVSHSDPDVDAIAEFPVQPGLLSEVSINLQNCDELHLNVSRFWVEWFPCGKQQVFDRFLEALTGVLSGRSRIVESYVFGKPATARLQVPRTNGTWKTVATWFSPWVLVPWLRHQRIVRNTPSPSV